MRAHAYLAAIKSVLPEDESFDGHEAALLILMKALDNSYHSGVISQIRRQQKAGKEDPSGSE